MQIPLNFIEEAMTTGGLKLSNKYYLWKLTLKPHPLIACSHRWSIKTPHTNNNPTFTCMVIVEYRYLHTWIYLSSRTKIASKLYHFVIVEPESIKMAVTWDFQSHPAHLFGKTFIHLPPQKHRHFWAKVVWIVAYDVFSVIYGHCMLVLTLVSVPVQQP